MTPYLLPFIIPYKLDGIRVIGWTIQKGGRNGEPEKTAYPGVFYKDVRRIGGKRDQKEKSYFIIFKRDGKNVEEHCGYQYRDNMTPSKAAKIRGGRIERRRKSRADIRKAKEAERWTFDKLWAHYLSNRPKAAPSDISRFNTYLKGTIADKRPVDLQNSDLDPIHELLSDKADGTRYSVLQLVNRISTYGKKQNLCQPIQFHIELPKVDSEKTEMLSQKELKSLLNTLHADGGQVAKLMEFALTTGMRKKSMLNLRWEHVNFEQNFIKIVRPKGQPTTTIPMNQAARSLLESMDQETEFVFQELQTRGGNWILIRAHMLKARAGLPDDFRPFHGLRHAFASLLASSGVPLYQVSALLTHRNLQMTARYSHLSDESKQAATDVLDGIINGGAGK